MVQLKLSGEVVLVVKKGREDCRLKLASGDMIDPDEILGLALMKLSGEEVLATKSSLSQSSGCIPAKRRLGFW